MSLEEEIDFEEEELSGSDIVHREGEHAYVPFSTLFPFSLSSSRVKIETTRKGTEEVA